ncbi:MAG TPA: serine/threonine-protein kinase [Actinocatenispora sp.]
MVEPSRADDPARIGPYQVVGRLGRGGMGDVFLGRSPGGRLVVVKVVDAELAGDIEFRRRFAAQVAAARRVGGFYTAQVVDASPDTTPAWVVTAYVPGPTLREAVERDGPMPAEAVRVLGSGLAEGLSAIHECGLVHGNLKPDNVILADDGPRVLDFGLARALEGSQRSTTTIVAPGFLAPEQARGHAVGPAADVFSYGCVLAYAVTGRPPFGAGHAAEVVYRIVHGEPDLGGVPEPLAGLIAACLAKDPAARPTPADVVAHLAGPRQPTLDWLPSEVTSPPIDPPSVGHGGPDTASAPTVPGTPPGPGAAAGSGTPAGPSSPDTGTPAGSGATGHGATGDSQAQWLPGRRTVLVAAGIGVLAAIGVPVGIALGSRDGDGSPKKGGGRPAASRRKFPDAGQLDLGASADSIVAIAFSPDGRYLGVTVKDGVQVWNMASRKQLVTLPITDGLGIRAVAFSRTGLLAAGYGGKPDFAASEIVFDTGVVRLWEVSTSHDLAKLTTASEDSNGLESMVDVAFSPDGATVAGARDGHDCIGKVPLWSVAGRQRIATLTVGAGKGSKISAVRSVAFSPDGRTLAAGYGSDLDGGIALWDASSHAEAGTLALDSTDAFGVSSLAFSPDSSLVAGAFGGVALWDVRARKLVAMLSSTDAGPDFQSVAYSPDGKLVAATSSARSAGGGVVIWDARTHRKVASIGAGRSGVSSLAFSPNGKLLAGVADSAKFRPVVQLWTVA